MLTDNIMYLKENYPILLENIKKENNEDILQIEDTKNGEKTLKVKNEDKFIYLHSKYNPTREAEAIIDKLEEREDIGEDSHVIFYGLGLGYHIEVFVKRHPNIKFSLYEPSVEVFNKFLGNINLKDLKTRNIENITCEYSSNARDEFFNEVLKKIEDKMIILELPIYEKVFQKEKQEFLSSFKDAVKGKRSSIHTDYAFQKRWIINSVANFKEVLNTPNILMQDKSLFKDKTAILVAAGPSLDLEIENLKKIKKDKSAYIFSVGSAINTLMHHDILPDVVATYDPKEGNQKVFTRMNEEGIDYIPMFFGSSVGLEVLEQFKGPKYHMITSQDTISSYFLKDEEEIPIDTVNDAPSIAVVTLQMLYKIGFRKIVLVGQNLAYSEEKSYASGIKYHENNVSLENALKVKDVYGNEIYTNKSFNNMRNQIEMYIKAFEDLKVINTTKNGAYIEGTNYMDLDLVIEKNLEIGSKNDIKEVITKNDYDLEYLTEKRDLVKKDYENYKVQIKDLREHISKIRQLTKNNNIKQLDNMYTKLDEKTNDLNNNNFFKIIVKPMHRVIYEILSTKISNAKHDKNPIQKSNKIIESFDMFLNSLLFSQSDFESIYILLMDRTNIENKL